MTPSSARIVARLAVGAALAIATAIALAGSLPASGEAIASTSVAATVSKPVERKADIARQAPSADPGPYSYRWPVKPFGTQHPVRGFFGDPRIANHGESRQFHFGIDISAPNGTAVYATLDGTAHIHPRHATTIAVVGTDGVVFSYWHVVPTVHSGQRVVAYRTVIGHVEAPYGHVHFSEMKGGRYLNPLRPGALGPFVDDTAPSVRSVRIVSDTLVAEAYDETPLAVPRPWHDLPVMPALVRFRLLDEGGDVAAAWRTAVDFRVTIPSAASFDETWGSGTTQNHVRAPGRYRLTLVRSLRDLRARSFVVEVEARDTRGNAARETFPIRLDTRAPLSARSMATPVPILMYHVVAEPPPGTPYPDLYVSPAAFTAQMRWLHRHGYQAVTQRHVWNHWHDGQRLPRKPIVISFDDGYRSVAEAAFPVLERWGWPAVLNLTVKNLRVAGGIGESRVRRLITSGWELASHTLTHPDLTTLDEPTLKDEVSRSRAVLRARFHVPVDFFCYPAGRYDARVVRAVRRAGYLGATTTIEGLARPGEPFELRRVRVNRGDSPEELGARLGN